MIAMSDTSSRDFAPIVLEFPHSKDEFRRIQVKDDFGEYSVFRISPSVADWPADRVPDKVNPRSHDEACLTGSVPKAIEDTLRKEPQDFWLANRGGFLLADRVKFDPDREHVSISLEDDDIHGLADGATTNAVIAKLQKQAATDEDLKVNLAKARYNLDVVVGLTDHDRIAKLVQGRNRSVQVKEWSLNDFRGEFDWLKDLIDRRGGPFFGKVGWEENSPAPVSVLDLISLATLFHPVYSAASRKRSAPTVAFSSKGTADKRLIDENMAPGYKALKPVLEDILRLYDHVYVNFEPTYEKYNREVHGKGSKLGKRKGIERHDTVLPLTGQNAEYRVDKGLIFPLLAAHRALLEFSDQGTRWKADPKAFFDKFGPDLVGRLFDEYEKLGRNPASVGKNRSVYENLYEKAENIYVKVGPELQSEEAA
jgi:hypothetical protein